MNEFKPFKDAVFMASIGKHLKEIMDNLLVLQSELQNSKAKVIQTGIENYRKLLNANIITERITPVHFIDNTMHDVPIKDIGTSRHTTYLYSHNLNWHGYLTEEEYNTAKINIFNDTWVPPNHIDEIDYYLQFALDFYSNIYNSEKFYLLSDIPEVLTVDRKVLSLVAKVKSIIAQTDRRIKESTQAVDSKVGKNDAVVKSRKLIDKALQDILINNKQYKNRGKLSREIEKINLMNGTQEAYQRGVQTIGDYLEKKYKITTKNFLERFKQLRKVAQKQS